MKQVHVIIKMKKSRLFKLLFWSQVAGVSALLLTAVHSSWVETSIASN